MTGHNNGASAIENRVVRRGTSNGNVRGNVHDRRRRREWLVDAYRADRSLIRVDWKWGSTTYESYVITVEELRNFDSVATAEEVPTCRCYRCGRLLTVTTVTVDRIIPGCQGGTYRRNNIRPACGDCNSETGAPLARHTARRTS